MDKIGNIYNNRLIQKHMETEVFRLVVSFVAGCTYLDLGFSVALRENLLETGLEDTDVVVDDSLLFSGMLLAHDTHQRQISAGNQHGET